MGKTRYKAANGRLLKTFKSRLETRLMSKSHFIPEIRLLKRCKTANLSGVLRKKLGPILGRDLNTSCFLPEIRLLKRCKTAYLSRVSRQALGTDSRQVEKRVEFYT